MGANMTFGKQKFCSAQEMAVRVGGPFTVRLWLTTAVNAFCPSRLDKKCHGYTKQKTDLIKFGSSGLLILLQWQLQAGFGSPCSFCSVGTHDLLQLGHLYLTSPPPLCSLIPLLPDNHPGMSPSPL